MTHAKRLTRYNVHLSRTQLQQLRRIHNAQGITPAEQIRRAIDAYLDQHKFRSGGTATR